MGSAKDSPSERHCSNRSCSRRTKLDRKKIGSAWDSPSELRCEARQHLVGLLELLVERGAAGDLALDIGDEARLVLAEHLEHMGDVEEEYIGRIRL